MTNTDTPEKHEPNPKPEHKEECATELWRAKENLEDTIALLKNIQSDLEQLNPDNFPSYRAASVNTRAHTIYDAVYMMLGDLIRDYAAPNPFVPAGCTDPNPFASEENF